MEGGPRACGVAADRWRYCKGGGAVRLGAFGAGCGPAVCGRGKLAFTGVTVDRSASKGAPDACIWQPAQPVRRIDLINQLSAPFSADSAPAGPTVGVTQPAADRSIWLWRAPGLHVHPLIRYPDSFAAFQLCMVAGRRCRRERCMLFYCTP
jgi:hypothetical protein